MLTRLKHEPPATQPEPASVRAQLRRILASRGFVASERMGRFLRLAVMETLEGRSEGLKEYRFGVEVFDRPDSFDPGADPIVRVEARRLRSKLAKYYETEGRFDEIDIDLPKGGYVPAFRKREGHPSEPPAPTAHRIAVLPFVELTGSSDGSCVGDGLTWELIHGLTRIESLAVVAWNSAAQLRGAGVPNIDLIREKLHIQTVLVGSIRRSGDRLRVVAQLIDAGSGVYLWSETYERSVEAAADIQQEISRAIVATLQVRLGDANAHLRTSATYNPEAYQLYLRGRGQWNRRTEEGLRAALESFSQAAALDPKLAVAYAGMADAYALLAEYGLNPPAEMMPHARAAAMRALEIDPSLGEAHCSLGLVAGIFERNWAQAEAHFRRALDLNPGYATTHFWFACDFLPILGRFEEAMQEIEIALALDPLSPIISDGKAFLYTLNKEYEESERQIRRSLSANPSFHRGYAALGRVLIQMKRYDEAIEMFGRARALGGDLPTVLGAMGQACGLSGKASEARSILAQLEEMRNARYAPATCLALTHLGLGEADAAIEWLSTGIDRHESSVVLIGVHPAYDALRGDPRFTKLVARLGLPQ